MCDSLLLWIIVIYLDACVMQSSELVVKWHKVQPVPMSSFILSTSINSANCGLEIVYKKNLYLY